MIAAGGVAGDATRGVKGWASPKLGPPIYRHYEKVSLIVFSEIIKGQTLHSPGQQTVSVRLPSTDRHFDNGYIVAGLNLLNLLRPTGDDLFQPSAVVSVSGYTVAEFFHIKNIWIRAINLD